MAQQKKQGLDRINLVMPAYLEAEQAILCCAMIDEYAVITILNELDESDFYSEANKRIFSAMQILARRNQPVDFVSVAGELETQGIMSQVGGINYLSILNQYVPSAANYKHYLTIVRKTSLRRKLIDSSNRITEAAYSPFDPKEPDKDIDVLELAEKEIYDLAKKNERSSLVAVRDRISGTISEIEERQRDPNASRGIKTQFRMLNKLFGGGLNKGDLIVIAARPGVGKTALAMNLVEHAVLNCDKKGSAGDKKRLTAAVFSLEMPMSQIIRRMLCSTAGVNMESVNDGKLSRKDWNKLFAAKSRLNEANLYVDDSSMITPVEILSKCRRLKNEHDLDIVMIDYLQLMGTGNRKNDNRVQEIGEISRMLKIAAKELEVPVLVLSQLSRDVEKRSKPAAPGKEAPPKSAQLSDLRDSGAIEQDADIVLFIEREYSADDSSEGNFACNLKIAKNRNGKTGYVPVVWQGQYVRYVEANSAEAEDYARPPVERPAAAEPQAESGDVPAPVERAVIDSIVSAYGQEDGTEEAAATDFAEVDDALGD